MKILKISGKNLASLAGSFGVDFEQEPLASSGLFAISGPTGAGKSTLLDALCLALYDATPRLLKVAGRASALPDVGRETVGAHDPRTLLRRGCAEGHAEVDFVGNDTLPYRARWSVRRARTKAEGGLQPTTMSLLQLPGLQPLGGTKTEVKLEIEQRIGLSFEQFTRAVLLAQNEFSTFLKTEDNERGELLETLTGSTVYSAMSMRAYERAKREQAHLQRLTARLADHKPWSAIERADSEAASADADAALAVIEQRKTALEAQLRWHEQGDRLQQQQELAQQDWHERVADADAAAPRRAALAQHEQVRAARPLADAVARIAADTTVAQSVYADGARAADGALEIQQAAAAALQQSVASLLEAEQARRAAAPSLNEARALDARIEAQRPLHQQATLACRHAEQADGAALLALQEIQARHHQLSIAQQAGAAWLSQHRPWQALAQTWPRWDLLFSQAGQAAAQLAGLTQAQEALQSRASALGAREAGTRASLAGATETMQTLEARRQLALAALAGFDAGALQQRRAALARQRERLAGAEKSWLELSTKQARCALLEAQQTQLAGEHAAAVDALARAAAVAPALQAALEQAERSLKGAEAACAANVETLRAHLTDDAPCPVCGALEHPYRHEDGALRAMLASLQGEVTACRRQAQDNSERQAGERARASHGRRQLDALQQESDAMQAAIARLLPLWHSHADLPGMPGDAARADWFTAQRDALEHELATLEQQEQKLHHARITSDQAQQACDKAAAAHAANLAAAAAARAELAEVTTQQGALDEKRQSVAAQLHDFLDELDSAFTGGLNDGQGHVANDDWRGQWHGAPEQFHVQRRNEAQQWLAQQGAHDTRRVALDGVALELKAAEAVLARAAHDTDAARAALASLDTARTLMQAQRSALCEGCAVHEVEATLEAALERAQADLQARRQADLQAGQDRARLDEAQAQAQRRLDTLAALAREADTRLDDWLADWKRDQAAQGDTGPADMRGHLHALLAIPAATLAAEQRALQALDAETARAATVLAERRQQLEQHRLQPPPPVAPAVGDLTPDAPVTGEPAAGELAAALARLNTLRKTAHDSATALHLALAQDDARRRSAQGMLAEIGAQEAIERRWATMNELIGSADGKKFRNYAQQFTLDVLLAYANAHLNQLARRYQLERINHPLQPSLGLMVRDLDMGGELRSVHSLSGGESFLVSLALALGLASLSSNRVRVESLFIDEGFGSLDSDTLRIAMDALDGLQSMGRKVGVISHVQEMTERIATRIVVLPTAGGRSTVSVT